MLRYRHAAIATENPTAATAWGGLAAPATEKAAAATSPPTRKQATNTASIALVINVRSAN